MTQPSTDIRARDGYCPTCREFNVAAPGRPCMWCDTILVRKRGGWRRPDRAQRSRITPKNARVLHALHTQGHSLRSISRAAYKLLGYSSAGSCLEGLRAAFEREGLSVQSGSDATAAANRRRSTRLPGEDKNAYRRRKRREARTASRETNA